MTFFRPSKVFLNNKIHEMFITQSINFTRINFFLPTNLLFLHHILLMKKLILILILLIVNISYLDAQVTCSLTSKKDGMTSEELLRWSEERPLTIICGNEKATLSSFEFTVFTRKPLQTKSFGLGDQGGTSILAHEFLKNDVKEGDTIILKAITAVKADGVEIKIDTISTVVKAQ